MPWILRYRITLLVGVGVVLRLAQYRADRDFWLDESSLAANIRRKSLAGLFGPLDAAQLAPAGFLTVEWVASRLLGTSNLALRLFPVACGIASVFLFARLAARVLRPEAAWIAVGLFALNENLVYYASELKQYSSDLALALGCTLAALAIASGEATRPRLAWFAALGVVGVWLSHPLAFVLGGIGTVLIASAVIRREWARALGLTLVSLAWAASFAGVYAVSVRQVGPSRELWVFWNFSFPRVPPATAWDAAWPLRKFAYLFANPLLFETPMGARGSALLGLGLFVAGVVSLWRRGQRDALALLSAPIVFTMAAAYPRLYPCHGRLVLFVVPALLLLIAEGASRAVDAIGRRRVLRAALLAGLFAMPVFEALNRLDRLRAMEDHTIHGDRRATGIDPDRFPL